MKIIFTLILLAASLLATIGEVTALQGGASLLRDKNESVVHKGLKLIENDWIKTQKHSKVQVILKDDTVITIGPRSEYLFERFRDSGDVEVQMHLQHGFFKAVTGKIGKIAPERFKIKTKAATIGIRGTQFMAHVQDNEEEIGCIHGKIIVWTADGEYTVPAGKMLIYKNNKWHLKEIDINAFSPVMLGMKLQKAYPQTNLLMPDIQESNVLEDQVVNRRAPVPIPQPEPIPLEPTPDPFDITTQSDDTPQPPAYNP